MILQAAGSKGARSTAILENPGNCMKPVLQDTVTYS